MKAGNGKRRHWSRLVAQFERSGESQARFTATAGVGVAAFRYWLYKLRRESMTPAPKRLTESDDVRLIPVNVRAPAVARRVDVRVCGVRLLVPVGVDATYIAQLAVAVQRASAC